MRVGGGCAWGRLPCGFGHAWWRRDDVDIVCTTIRSGTPYGVETPQADVSTWGGCRVGLGTPGGVETMWTSSLQLGVRRWVERRVEGYKKCGRGKINHGRAFFLTGR